MNKTENYQLSQWALPDRIMMEDFNSDNARIEAALTGLESRKLELVKVFDVTKTLSDVSYWAVDLKEMNHNNCTALFVFFQMPNTTSYSVALGTGSGLHLGYVYGRQAGLMGWPLRNPEMSVTLIPIGGAQEFTTRTPLLYENLNAITLCPPSTNETLNGTFRCQGLIIP